MKRTIEITLLCLLILGCRATMAQGPATADVPYVCPPCGDGACDEATFTQPGVCPVCGRTLIKQSNLKNVAIFIYDGMEILDFSGPGEVFAAARPESGAFRVFTVAAAKDPIISQGFVKILPEFSIEDCPRPDIIVLPGGSTRASVENPRVIEWIQTHAPHLDAAVSVCTGVFLLHKAGLLDGKKATTWHGAIGALRERAAATEVLENTRWVDNGQVVTTAGVSAGIDGSLRVVEKLFGRQTALATARYMEYDKWDPEDGVVVEKR